MDLSDQAEVFGKKLSGGQKRKMNVGMALIGDPKVLNIRNRTTIQQLNSWLLMSFMGMSVFEY